jgi:hypothetical protein
VKCPKKTKTCYRNTYIPGKIYYPEKNVKQQYITQKMLYFQKKHIFQKKNYIPKKKLYSQKKVILPEILAK